MTAPSGPLIGSAFGLIFVLANAGSLPQTVGAMLQGIAFAVFVAIVLTLRHRAGRRSPCSIGRRYSGDPGLWTETSHVEVSWV